VSLSVSCIFGWEMGIEGGRLGDGCGADLCV